MNVLVFDIETIPDIDSGRRLYNLEGLDMNDAAELMFSKRRQQSQGASDFLPVYLHKIVAISVVLKRQDTLRVSSLGDCHAGERELVQRFFNGIERYTPVLVSWNGGGFDLPVLRYRAMLHGVVGSRYWEDGEEDQAFRWNNYLSRYHSRHTDLMDVLSGYIATAKASLDSVASILGFPGKMGMDGSQVWEYYRQDDIESIRHYCETDVLNTYLIYLRYQFIRGHLSEQGQQAAHDELAAMLEKSGKPHFTKFLQLWQAD